LPVSIISLLVALLSQTGRAMLRVMYEHTNIRYKCYGVYLCCFTRSWPEDPGC